jgi:hypothetical protein
MCIDQLWKVSRGEYVSTKLTQNASAASILLATHIRDELEESNRNQEKKQRQREYALN